MSIGMRLHVLRSLIFQVRKCNGRLDAAATRRVRRARTAQPTTTTIWMLRACKRRSSAVMRRIRSTGMTWKMDCATTDCTLQSDAWIRRGMLMMEW